MLEDAVQSARRRLDAGLARFVRPYGKRAFWKAERRAYNDYAADEASKPSVEVQLLVETALVAQLKLQFKVGTEPGPNGGYVITAPDGRQGEFLAQPIEECQGQVELFYDLYWVTG